METFPTGSSPKLATRCPRTELVVLQADFQQAFRLYTLAMAGAPEHGAMNRMKELPTLSQQAKWRLAAAYALNGKEKAAGELVFSAKTTVEPYSSNKLCIWFIRPGRSNDT